MPKPIQRIPEPRYEPRTNRATRPQEGANVVDRTGQRYGLLVVIARAGSRGAAAAWLCRCDCGTEKVIASDGLRNGTKSCGCSRRTGPGSRPYYKTKFPFGRATRNRVLKSYKFSAQARGLSWNLSDSEFDRLMAGDCLYCGAAPSTIEHGPNGDFVHNGIDRVDNAAGYESHNVAPCCPICNHAKHTMGQTEFWAWLHRIAAYLSPIHNQCPRVA